MLVPDAPDAPTQVVDVRDLAAWLLDAAQAGTTGTYNAVGPSLPFARWIELSRTVGGHRGPVVLAPADWLLGQGVAEYLGPDSLSMWLIEPGMEGWSSQSGAAAARVGVTVRVKPCSPIPAGLGTRTGPGPATQGRPFHAAQTQIAGCPASSDSVTETRHHPGRSPSRRN